MTKFVTRGSINFETLKSENRLVDKVSYCSNRLRMMKNPYTGNKRKFLFQIFSTLEKHNIKYKSILDLFSGTGCVATTARYLGKKVFANDLMKYSHCNLRFLVENENITLTDSEKKKILKISNISDSYILKKYSNRFTEEECRCLDSIRENISTLFGNELNDKSVIAYLSVLRHVTNSCFIGGRLNNGQVLANLDHRLQHQKNRGNSMTFERIDWLKPFINNNKGKTFNNDAINLLQNLDEEIDLCYIDPPYGGDQSDYFTMYKFYEDFILGKDAGKPEAASHFTQHKNYSSSLKELLHSLDKIPNAVFSYSTSSFATVDEIKTIISEYRKNVYVEQFAYKYNYCDGNDENLEYLIISTN